MARSLSNHEPRPRNRGEGGRLQVACIRETCITNSTDSRVFIGEPARLLQMSDNTFRIVLPNQRGVVATHGHLVVASAKDAKNKVLITESGERHSIPKSIWKGFKA